MSHLHASAEPPKAGVCATILKPMRSHMERHLLRTKGVPGCGQMDMLWKDARGNLQGKGLQKLTAKRTFGILSCTDI
jgi:hypothetical protein